MIDHVNRHMKRSIWLALTLFTVLTGAILSSRSATVKKGAEATKKEAKAVKVASAFNTYVAGVYQAANLSTTGLNIDVFQKAVTGYFNLKQNNKLAKKSSVITVIDFNKPSSEKRMWIVDLDKKQLLLNTWVAHGRGSGELMATQFSNRNSSNQSSLGFYVTNEIYYGKHGRSLKLDGMDNGFNDNARSRAVVLHAANYVCEKTIEATGRLGRSQGCPAVSPDVSNKIIDLIKGKNMIFINASMPDYTSKYLDDNFIAQFTAPVDSSIQLTPNVQ
jgi:hypothetical protein